MVNCALCRKRPCALQLLFRTHEQTTSADLNQRGCLPLKTNKYEWLEREDCANYPQGSHVEGYRSSNCSQRRSQKLTKSQVQGACLWVIRESCDDTEVHRGDRGGQRAQRGQGWTFQQWIQQEQVTPLTGEQQILRKLPFAPRHQLGHKEEERKLFRRETTLVHVC